MPRRSKKKRDVGKDKACVHLKTLNVISNSYQPLCECVKRDLILGKNAKVCSVCRFFKPSNKIINELYVAEILESKDYNWDDEDYYYEMKEKGEFLDYFDDEEEYEEEFDRRYKAQTKSGVKTEGKKKAGQEDDEDLISEELFGGKDVDEEEELTIEDETQEVTELYDAKEESLKESGELEELEDDEFGEIEDFGEEDEVGAGTSASVSNVPEIKKTSDGKEICPFCKKQYKSVMHHISYCKRASDAEKKALKDAN
ncbi:MAG: hypothetical protein GF364_17245 [Candidatus Lokiarchaeota archaeon]|nr:hypothetical protein [Candidatus Lokiarchaeota archaeon]